VGIALFAIHLRVKQWSPRASLCPFSGKRNSLLGAGYYLMRRRTPPLWWTVTALGYRVITRKAPEALTPPLFSLPSGSKIYYDHVGYKPKGCKCLKLVIYRTFYVFVMIIYLGIVIWMLICAYDIRKTLILVSYCQLHLAKNLAMRKQLLIWHEYGMMSHQTCKIWKRVTRNVERWY